MTGRSTKKPHLSRIGKSGRWLCKGAGIYGYGDSKREAYDHWLAKMQRDAMSPLDRAHEAEVLAMRYFDQGFLDLAETLQGLSKVIRYQHSVLHGV